MSIFKTSCSSAFLDPYFILREARLADGMRVADLGCGTIGHFTIPAGKIVGETGRIFAVDLLESALEGVKSRLRVENLRNVEPVLSDLEKYGITDIDSNSVDLVLLANTLWQAKERAEMFREAVRMLREDGTIVVVEWDPEHETAPMAPPLDLRIDRGFLRDLARRHDLMEVKEFQASPYHYSLIFIK